MTILEARAKIEERLNPILERALAEGLCAKLSIMNVGKDFLHEEADEKKVRFISADVSIGLDGDDINNISFGVAVECCKGACDDKKMDDDLIFAEERAAEFFEELSAAPDKKEFTKARIAEEKELRAKTAEQINQTLRTSWVSSIIALCVGGAILVAAAVVAIILI